MNNRDATTLLHRYSAEIPVRATRERFAPGSIVAGRYRIVALLGRGGMGEVYRAEDLRLDQQVALKFLPPRLQANPEALELFLGELRLGRQVSHPNVCRLYDLGDHDGHDFITMEYVDGEDLSSLLARIGKLPEEKAIQIARDVAAGLAAAHALGIVHRDLKPSNIMIDGRGRARVTDFGLAVLESSGSDGRIVGTPAYMAPEQFTGADATPRSDVYALGLILYELLTGEPLHRGESGEAIIRERIRNTSSGSVTSLPAIDPIVDRLLRRCLDPDPLERPESAQVVLRSLPGGDPLAAAIAAGETPSPELVAAATGRDPLTVRTAWMLLAAVVLLTLVAAFLANRTMLHQRVAKIRAPQGLAERASEIAATYVDAPVADSGWFTQWDFSFLTWAARHWTDDSTLNTQPGPVRFWYRQSPQGMVPLGWDGRMLENDPPMDVPGMARVALDHRGRLLELRAVPPLRREAAAPFTRWDELFALAELPMDRFTPATPQFSMNVDSDQRYAWTGVSPGSTMPLRVEAAARDGKPVWFAVLAPWQIDPAKLGALDMVSDAIRISLELLVPLVCGVLALLNLRRGRGDRRGALRLATLGFVTLLVARLLRAHHSASLEEPQLLMRILADVLLVGFIIALGYLALEPYIRRLAPEAMISWVRAVHGRWRDPLVGRDVLIGAFAATAAVVLWHLSHIVQPLLGFRDAPPVAVAGTSMGTLSDAAYLLLWNFTFSITDGITLAVLMIVARSITKRRWLSNALLLLFVTLVLLRITGDVPAIRITYCVIVALMVMLVLKHAGLLGVTMMAFTANIYVMMPVTLDTSAYYFGRSAVTLLIPLTIAAFACWAAIIPRTQPS